MATNSKAPEKEKVETPEVETAKVETPEVEEAAVPKTTKVKLFKDNGKYKSDVFCCVNGKAIQIQRGVEVEVPAAYAEVLENSARQDGKTAELIDQKAAEFQSEVKRLNI